MKPAEDSIGTYFQKERRSSNPIKEKGRDASYFQNTLENVEWGENSGFLQLPCESSTPNPKPANFISDRSTNQRSASLTKVLQRTQDIIPGRISQGSSRYSSILTQDSKRDSTSLFQELNETNGSIRSMARIFSGPDASKLGSQDIMTQVLQYC